MHVMRFFAHVCKLCRVQHWRFDKRTPRWKCVSNEASVISVMILPVGISLRQQDRTIKLRNTGP